MEAELQWEVSKRSQVPFIQQVCSEHPLCTSRCFRGCTGRSGPCPPELHFVKWCWFPNCRFSFVPTHRPIPVPLQSAVADGNKPVSRAPLQTYWQGGHDAGKCSETKLPAGHSVIGHVYLLSPHPAAPCLTLLGYFRLQVH